MKAYEMRTFLFLAFIFFSVCFLPACGKIHSSFLLISADMAYNQGNMTKAIELYRELLESDSSQADVQWKLGIAYYSHDEKSNAKKQIAILRDLKRDDLADDLQQLLAQ